MSEPEKWIGFRQDGDQTFATFALPSGRLRYVKVTRVELLQAIAEAARALKWSEPKS